MKMNQKNTYIIIIIIFAAITLLLGISVFSQATQSSAKPVQKYSGKALIGGDFNLTNQDNSPVSASDFKGQYLLVFFGFTSCPMVCPVGLTNISQTLEQLGEKAKNITPLFITVDPQRDTANVLKEYLANFHPSIVGLTGSKEQLDNVARAYKVYSSKVKDPTNIEAGYTMDHSSFTYLMDKNGEYLKHFNHDMKSEEVTAIIDKIIK